jgi:hypothetical protein
MADFGSSIIAYFGGDTSGLEKAVSKAETVVGSFQSAMGKIGIGIGSAAVIGFFKSVIDKASAIGDLATSLGMSTKALQAFQRGAELAGGSADEVSRMLFTMKGKIDELAAANPAAVKSFEALGLSARDLVGIPLEDALSKIATAYMKNAEKAGAYSSLIDIVGTRSRNLLGFLRELADGGFGALIAKMEAANQIIGDDTIVRLKEAGDTFTQLKNTMTIGGAAILGTIMSMVEPIGAFFGTLWEHLTRFKQIFADIGKYGFLGAAGKITTEVLQDVEDSMGKVGKTTKTVEGAVVKLSDAFKSAAEKAKELQLDEKALRQKIERLEMQGDRQGKLNALLALANKYAEEALGLAEGTVERKEAELKVKGVILEYDKESAKQGEAARLSKEDELELVRLMAKDYDSLTGKEKERLRILQLMTWEKDAQAKIATLTEKAIQSELTEEERQQLNTLYKQLDVIKEQLTALNQMPAAIQPAVTATNQWLSALTQVSMALEGISGTSQWGNESNRVLEEMRRRKQTEKGSLETQLWNAPGDPTGLNSYDTRRQIATLGMTIDNITDELTKRKQAVQTLQMQGPQAALSGYSGDPRSFERFMQLALGNDTTNLANAKNLEEIRLMLQNFFGR